MCILTDEVDAWNDMDWQHALFSVAPLLCSKQTMRLWILLWGLTLWVITQPGGLQSGVLAPSSC
jgi:hypothetical protein